MSGDLRDDEAVEDIVALAAANRVPIAYVARTKLDAAARTDAPQGVLARAAAIPELDFATLLTRRPGRPPFLVAVDGVTDPGNLGAIVRSCDGAGVDALVLPRHRAVHVTPTVAKAAAGAVEHVRMAVVPGLPAALARLHQAGIWIVGLDDAADRTLFDLGDLATEGVCIVLGAEGAGLSRLVRTPDRARAARTPALERRGPSTSAATRRGASSPASARPAATAPAPARAPAGRAAPTA